MAVWHRHQSSASLADVTAPTAARIEPKATWPTMGVDMDLGVRLGFELELLAPAG